MSVCKRGRVELSVHTSRVPCGVLPQGSCSRLAAYVRMRIMCESDAHHTRMRTAGLWNVVGTLLDAQTRAKFIMAPDTACP